MPRTSELKMRIDPALKAEATKLYGQWGLNLTDAVTIFLNQSVAAGGLPFPMRKPVGGEFAWDSPELLRRDAKVGHAVLPAEWDADEDSVYDSL